MDDQGEEPRSEESRRDEPPGPEGLDGAAPRPRSRTGRDGNPGRFWAGLNRHRTPEGAGDRTSA